MDKLDLKKRIKQKSDLDVLVSEIIDHPLMISELIDIINSDTGSVKFSCTKVIRMVSEKEPEIVYRYFNEIDDLLESENSFVKWDAITILSNLTSVDTGKKFDAIFERFFSLINDPRMITAANVVGNAWKVVKAKPYLEKEITGRLLSVPGNIYLHQGKPSPECNCVLCGHLIDCFSRYFAISGSKTEILEFVKGQLKSTRSQVVKKSEKFLAAFS